MRDLIERDGNLELATERTGGLCRLQLRGLQLEVDLAKQRDRDFAACGIDLLAHLLERGAESVCHEKLAHAGGVLCGHWPQALQLRGGQLFGRRARQACGLAATRAALVQATTGQPPMKGK